MAEVLYMIVCTVVLSVAPRILLREGFKIVSAKRGIFTDKLDACLLNHFRGFQSS